ncbi:hypothetical protein ONZ43_g5346 [Nemania bipapillata]|uniref:Uncharacterized protein n=1 Tax=Nemania bipapillata TaxID=110536 RepID=A0ACC2IBY0_9PEZI|nr:hypothetical protein ONZ43_g5346 [Nemania bipapillata]
MPVEMKDAEPRPPTKGARPIRDLTGPFILDRVLFMRGVLLDEIIGVFPLPKNDPFKLLQQVWYLERLYGRPNYDLLHQGLPAESESRDIFDVFVREMGGISAYPSIVWATRFAELPYDMSIVHIISKTANFEPLSIAIKKSLDLISVCVKQQFESEGKKFGRGASREERDEYWKRDGEVEGRLRSLTEFLLVDKWLDFIGICTFDLESLRAQVRYHSVPMMAWKPSRLPGSSTSYEGPVNKCDLPFESAVFQRPVRYSSLLRAVAKDVKCDYELKMRRDVVILLAEAVHEAAAPVVGGQSEVQYTRLKSGTRSSSGGKDGFVHMAKDDDDETIQHIVGDFVMAPLPEDAAVGDYIDTPLVGFFAPAEETRGVRRIDSYLEKSNLKSKVEERQEDRRTSDSPEVMDDSRPVGKSSTAENAIELTRRGKPTETPLPPNGDTNIGDEQVNADVIHATGDGFSRHTTLVCSTPSGSQQAIPRKKTKPRDEPAWWRRTERRKSAKGHFLLQEVIEFLGGRKFFITETRLLGLTGPGEQDICDGDDLLLLEGMAFPLIARLEPSESLGNPKKRRRDMSTTGMRREILGTAIVRNIDPKGGKLDEAELPEDFEPLSGCEPEFFTFK